MACCVVAALPRATVKRRLASWSTFHRWRGIEGPFAPRRGRARDVLDRLIATCATDRLANTRDLAILLLAFASGGRRRSEVARLRVEQLMDAPPELLDPRNAKSPTLPRLAIQLGRTKTTDAG